MPALVIDAFPEALHDRLKKRAASHKSSVEQETIRLIQKAMDSEEISTGAEPAIAYWKKRPLLPEYEALIRSGAMSGGMDSTQMISEDRDGR